MKCEICGKEIEESLYIGMIICSQECFNIHFWNRTLDNKAIIINGKCYHDGGYVEKPVKTSYLGHSGRTFKIRFKSDGKTIVTNNLWYNGVVPKERNVKDNAEFI